MSKELICDAIAKRLAISFLYKGSQRTVEPHTLGYDRSGDLTLSAWQVSGGSGQGWRDFHIDKMRGIALTATQFSGARPGYNRNDSTLAQIICGL
jgi:predicted DNA-binding transcriptional regulator YafY